MLHLRQTILNDYLTCPYKCYKAWGEVGVAGKYDLEESPGNIYAKIGVVFHKVMEEAGNTIINGKRNEVTYDSLIKQMRFFFENYIPKEMFEDETAKDEWWESLSEQVYYAYNTTLQSKNILMCEYNFMIEDMFEGLPPVTGTIDRVDGNLENKDINLIDYKTGKVYTKKQLQNNIQACLYSLAFYRNFGVMPKTFTFIFTKHKKVKTIQITKDFIERVGAEIIRIVQEMNNNHFEPTCNNKFFCSHFCEFYEECPKHKRSKNKGWNAVKEK